MSHLPRRPVGLRADQADAWEQHAADQYGADTVPDRGPVDPAWVAECERAADARRIARELSAQG
jgi:hypothetical protein